MAFATDNYSRIVTWLKVALPLCALAILSTVFLLARKPVTETLMPSIANGPALGQTTGIRRPSFAGVASDGSSIELVARDVREVGQDAKQISADGIQARVVRPGGMLISIASTAASVDLSAQKADFTDGVAVETSTGYLVQSAKVHLDLDTSRLETDAGIGAETPIGTLTADAMISEPAAGDTAPVLVFNGNVHLIYEPKEQR